MNHLNACRSFALFLLSTLTGFAESSKLNIIAIVTDDQAAWTLGCYGGKEIPTPNLDGMAASGARFSNAFIQTPVCSPSRGTYLTSKLPTELGFTDFLTNQQAKKQGINGKFPTWTDALTKQGYTTGLVGKWHVGMSEPSLPWNNGISSFNGNLGGAWSNLNFSFINEKNSPTQHPGFSVEVCTDLAIEFTNSHKNSPFALLLHYREPHADYIPMPEQDMQTAKNATLRTPDYPGLKQPYTDKQRRDYYASIAALDRNIGRLLQHLKSSGLDKNTIVMFTSDHGYNLGEHGLHFKGNASKITTEDFGQQRPNMFDTSIRVPLIIQHPLAKNHQTISTWVTQADVFASVLGMLNLNPDKNAPASSRDFSPAIFGKSLPEAKFPTELFGQYDLVNNPTKRSMRMIRTNEWKLILHLNAPAQNELYNLSKDPDELHNEFALPASLPTIQSLREKLVQHMSAINDPKLPSVPNF